MPFGMPGQTSTSMLYTLKSFLPRKKLGNLFRI